MKDFLKEEALKKLEDAVTELEKSTSAEIVVAISRFSESYRDVVLIFSYIMSAVPLVFILTAPWEFHYILIIPLMVLFFFGGYFLCHFYHPLMEILVSKRKKTAGVRKASRLAFYEEHVSATRERTGILFYISLFERQVEILPDLAIDGKIPRAHWNRLSAELSGALKEKEPVDMFAEKILSCAELLKSAFPPGEDNPDEIPNRPRIR